MVRFAMLRHFANGIYFNTISNDTNHYTTVQLFRERDKFAYPQTTLSALNS